MSQKKAYEAEYKAQRSAYYRRKIEDIKGVYLADPWGYDIKLELQSVIEEHPEDVKELQNTDPAAALEVINKVLGVVNKKK